MSTLLETIQGNLLSAPILLFALGLLAAVVKSNLKVPEALYQSLILYLLLAIGFKGGAALAKSDPGAVWQPALAALALSALIPISAYAVLRRRFDAHDAASIAAHYGSVSAVTFITAGQYLDSQGVPYESYASALLAVMETPAIISAVILLSLARRRDGEKAGRDATSKLGVILHEAFTDKSVILLMGGMVAGAIAGQKGVVATQAFFVAPFQGVLALFLLEMGLITGKRLPDLRKAGVFLIAFALLAPPVHGAIGAFLGVLTGMSVGGATMLAVLAASASYIAVPAAMRTTIPEANPVYSLTGALVLTFPFNITLGLPLYRMMAEKIHATMA